MHHVFIYCLLLGVLLSSSPPVEAGNCRVIHGVPYCQPYTPPVYHAPYVAPVHHAPYEEKIKIQEILVPILQPYPYFIEPRISYLHNGGNYVNIPLRPVNAVQPLAPEPKSSAGVSEVDLDNLINKIEQRVRERQNQQVSEPDGPPPVPGFTKITPPTAVRRTAFTVLQRCAGCHTGEKSKGDVVIFSVPGVLSSTLDRAAILDAVRAQDGQPARMPPAPRLALPLSDVQLLEREWGWRS